MVQHFLRDLPVFVKLLIDIGANPRNIVLIRKTYGYLDGEIAYNQLKEMGVKIVKLSQILSQQLSLKKKVINQAFNKCSLIRIKPFNYRGWRTCYSADP